MKTKSVVYRGRYSTFVEEIESMRPEVRDRVLVPHLHVPRDIGPAEAYIQECDFVRVDAETLPTEGMCEVRLTGVSGPSINKSRKTSDYWDALDALALLFTEKIRALVPKGHRIQLFVSIGLDEPIPRRDGSGPTSTWVESNPVWVDGQA